MRKRKKRGERRRIHTVAGAPPLPNAPAHSGIIPPFPLDLASYPRRATLLARFVNGRPIGSARIPAPFDVRRQRNFEGASPSVRPG